VVGVGGKTATGTPKWSFYKADRRVTCYYFYLWEADFGPAFLDVCAWFPYPGKVGLNGHEWAQRQAPRPASASPSCPTARAGSDTAATGEPASPSTPG
jgi:hypothetical protein